MLNILVYIEFGVVIFESEGVKNKMLKLYIVYNVGVNCKVFYVSWV